MASKTLIISDLHLGNAGDYDIFAGAETLPALLQRFEGPGNRIYINGDSVDFLMNEDPLELDEARALAQTQRSMSAPATVKVMHALGKVLAAGGEVVIRLGNHDIELAIESVQQCIRATTGQPAEIAARLTFERGEQPAILTVGGARILVTHGEQNDPWNRVEYTYLPGPNAGPEANARRFTYAPGSRLVKTLLNPLKKRYSMRFADLIKPDFQGGVLTALAVNPLAVSTIFQGSTLKLMWQLFRQMGGPDSFGEAEENLGLATAIDQAGLTPEERAAITSLLDPSGPVSFADDENPTLDSARAKLGRAGLRWYAAKQRSLVGDTGKRFFALEPEPEEWKEAQRLADKFNVNAVIFGHTHAARWRAEDSLTFVNTGTWIWLMTMPPSDASDEEWTTFLETIRNNPKLDPARGATVPLQTRFTGAVIEEGPHGHGAKVSLIEMKDNSELVTLGETLVQPGRGASA